MTFRGDTNVQTIVDDVPIGLHKKQLEMIVSNIEIHYICVGRGYNDIY
jgi:hypothetical protein